MSRIAISCLCLPKQFKAMQSTDGVWWHRYTKQASSRSPIQTVIHEAGWARVPESPLDC